MQLAEGKTEAKALTMKLAAARTAEAAAAGKAAAGFMPGSAIKNSAMSRGGAAGAVQQATQVAQWKEELYGDLTGLIVRDVKEDAAGEKVYDCIQTGRNGSKLFCPLSLTVLVSPDIIACGPLESGPPPLLTLGSQPFTSSSRSAQIRLRRTTTKPSSCTCRS